MGVGIPTFLDTQHSWKTAESILHLKLSAGLNVNTRHSDCSSPFHALGDLLMFPLLDLESNSRKQREETISVTLRPLPKAAPHWCLNQGCTGDLLDTQVGAGSLPSLLGGLQKNPEELSDVVVPAFKGQMVCLRERGSCSGQSHFPLVCQVLKHSRMWL